MPREAADALTFMLMQRLMGSAQVFWHLACTRIAWSSGPAAVLQAKPQ